MWRQRNTSQRKNKIKPLGGDGGGPNEVEISNLPEEFKVMVIKIFTELRKKSGET